MDNILIGIYLAGAFSGFVAGFIAHTIYWYKEFHDVAFPVVVASMLFGAVAGVLWPLALLAVILWGSINFFLEKTNAR